MNSRVWRSRVLAAALSVAAAGVFAATAAQQAFPNLHVSAITAGFLQGDAPIGVLVVSHVLNELDEIARADLAALCRRAETILWVEPGTHEVSRALGNWRERLRAEGLQPVAPCPHAAACGVLGATLFSRLCGRHSLRPLLAVGILTHVFAALLFLGYRSESSAIFITGAAGALRTLVQ